MSADLEIFPECPGYGFTAQPQYMVNIIRREGGYERTDSRWSRCLNVYTSVPLGPRDESEIQSILYFWHAMGGRATTFLIKDWADYKSCQTQSDPTALDQPLVPIDLEGGGTGYRLVKRYSVGSFTQDREITKPDGATILIANESGTTDNTWTLDDDNGLIVPGGGFSGTPTSWGGEFLVPVRFNSELELQITDKQIQSVQFTLMEKRMALSNVFTGDVSGGGAGLVWTATSYDDLPISFDKVTSGSGGKLVALGGDSGIYISTDDGDTWTLEFDFATSNLVAFCITYGNGKFIAAGSDATTGHSKMFSSPDGVTWSAVTVDDIGDINSVCYGSGNHWVATSTTLFANNYATSSDNAATFHIVTTTPVDQFSNGPMYYHSSTFVTTGVFAAQGGCIITSTDNGATWSGSLVADTDFSTASNPGLFSDGATLIVGGNGNSSPFLPCIIAAASPTDLLAATAHSSILPMNSDTIYGIIKALGIYFVINGAGQVADSTDGSSWTLDDTGTSGEFLTSGQQSLTFNGNKVIAMFNAHMIRITPP